MTEADDKVWLVFPGSWLGPGSGQAVGMGAGRASRHSPHFPPRNWHKTQPELCRREGAGRTLSLREVARGSHRARRSQEGGLKGMPRRKAPLHLARLVSPFYGEKTDAQRSSSSYPA